MYWHNKKSLVHLYSCICRLTKCSQDYFLENEALEYNILNSTIGNNTCNVSVMSDIFNVWLLSNHNTSIWITQDAWSALPHLKLCDRYASVESSIDFKRADGAGHPYSHGGVGDDCHTSLHLPLLTKLWCCWCGRAENQMMCLIFMQQNTDVQTEQLFGHGFHLRFNICYLAGCYD